MVIEKYGDYDFWDVSNSESNHDTITWKRISKYISGTRTEQGLIDQIMPVR